jgi:large subunit ribosomal protein L7/L12
MSEDKKTLDLEENSKGGEKEKIKVPAKFKKIVEEIEKMSVLDLSELVKLLEEKFGVSAQMAVAPAASGAGEVSAESEVQDVLKTVELKNSGDQKIQVIKVIRDVLEMGLKEAKELVDAAPKVVKEGLKSDEAEELKKKLEEAGATVEVK